MSSSSLQFSKFADCASNRFHECVRSLASEHLSEQRGFPAAGRVVWSPSTGSPSMRDREYLNGILSPKPGARDLRDIAGGGYQITSQPHGTMKACSLLPSLPRLPASRNAVRAASASVLMPPSRCEPS